MIVGSGWISDSGLESQGTLYVTLDINGGSLSSSRLSGVSSARLNMLVTRFRSLSLFARVTCLTESGTCRGDTRPARSHCPPDTPAWSGQLRRAHTRHTASSAPGIIMMTPIIHDGEGNNNYAHLVSIWTFPRG